MCSTTADTKSLHDLNIVEYHNSQSFGYSGSCRMFNIHRLEVEESSENTSGHSLDFYVGCSQNYEPFLSSDREQNRERARERERERERKKKKRLQLSDLGSWKAKAESPPR